jgi:hypothetical protein
MRYFHEWSFLLRGVLEELGFFFRKLMFYHNTSYYSIKQTNSRLLEGMKRKIKQTKGQYLEALLYCLTDRLRHFLDEKLKNLQCLMTLYIFFIGYVKTFVHFTMNYIFPQTLTLKTTQNT